MSSNPRSKAAGPSPLRPVSENFSPSTDFDELALWKNIVALEAKAKALCGSVAEIFGVELGSVLGGEDTARAVELSQAKPGSLLGHVAKIEDTLSEVGALMTEFEALQARLAKLVEEEAAKDSYHILEQ